MISRRTALVAGGAGVIAAAGGGVYLASRDKPEPPAPPSVDGQNHLLWRNWSGIAYAYPAVRSAPRDEAGVASALVFSTGGLLAARLGARQPARSGFLLGLYYGGTGLGIVASALVVPLVLQAARGQAHAWAWAWWVLALVCAMRCSKVLKKAEEAKREGGAEA